MKYPIRVPIISKHLIQLTTQIIKQNNEYERANIQIYRYQVVAWYCINVIHLIRYEK